MWANRANTAKNVKDASSFIIRDQVTLTILVNNPSRIHVAGLATVAHRDRIVGLGAPGAGSEHGDGQ